MKRIILGLVTIIGASAAMYVGATGAFFSDTESSVGNVFTAGAVDLLVDNESYVTDSEGDLVFNEATSWAADNLNNGEETLHLFFDFDDIKPGDIGEDTISLHVQNDAWMCMNVELTSNDDNDCNEPETGSQDPQCIGEEPGSTPEDGEGNGELGGLVQMLWWADDGDNVLETDEVENFLHDGIENVITLTDNGALSSVALADSAGSVWPDGGPVPADEPRYLAKAWCFGTLALNAVAQDGVGQTGTGNGDSTNGPLVRGTGFTCTDPNLGNESQTDSLTLDVSFDAVQARNNDEFVCEPIVEEPATLTLIKSVDNGTEGSADGSEWTLTATGPTNISGVSGAPEVTSVQVEAGAYVLGENSGIPGYNASQYSCVINGNPAVLGNNINLAENDIAVCTITNTVNACTVGLQYADAAGTFAQGTQKSGAAVLANRSVPSAAFGAPQTSGAASDVGFPAGSFVSLGFDLIGGSPHGSLVLDFFNNIVLNGPGDDLKVFEVTGGAYPDEKFQIEVSQDGITFFPVTGTFTRDATVDIASSGLDWARYVKVTDVSVIADFPSDADAYDLDAIEALNCAMPVVQQ